MKQIPANATCVYDGAIFKVYQRPQLMFDGTTKIFECVERQDTAFVLPVQDNQVLLVYQRQPQKPDRYRDFVGGRVHRGGDPLEGAQRELREEAGMQSSDLTLRRFYDLGGGSVKWNWHFYITREFVQVWPPELDPGGEDIQLKRVSKERFAQMLLSDELKAIGLSREFLQCTLAGKEEDFLWEIFG